MIRITIEVWPKGSLAMKKVKGFINIVNDSTGTKRKGNYKVKAYTTYTKQGQLIRHLIRQFEIKNHPRQAQSIWLLLKKVFEVW